MIDDLYQLMSGDDPRAAAASMAAALRGNRQLAGINAVAGGGLGALGALQAAESKQQSDLAEKGLVARMHYGEEARRATLANALEKLKATQDFNAAEKEKDRASALERTMAMIGGRLAAVEAAGRNKPSMDDKEYDKAQQDIKAWSMDVDANMKARNANSVAAQNLYRSASAQALLKGGMVPKQFLEDVAITMARIAGGGGNVGEKMADELKAKGLPADVAGMKAYWQGRPVDAGMQEWMKLIVQKFKQEDEVANEFIRQSTLKQASRMGRAAKYAPEDWRRALTQHGVVDYMGDDLLSTYAPPSMAHKVGRATVAADRKRVGDGKRLVYSPEGQPGVAEPGEALPAGWWEPK